MALPYDYLDSLQARGRYLFTTDEAEAALKRSGTATRAALRRLKADGVIADPVRGYHVIVPPEYRRLGCLPPDQFVPELMKRLDEPYYAALLTAAAYHGAGHQRPQVFQVMVPGPRRPIVCGDVRVEFMSRCGAPETSVVERNTRTGVLRIASPAATALETLGYINHCGGLDNAATVIAELVETIDRNDLAAEAERAAVAWVQRLGYLLVLLGAEDLASVLDTVLAEKRPFLVPLAAGRPMTGHPTDSRWKLSVNTRVEPDV
jgi:predicted transcriptional regulator of viral defense system